VRSGLQEKYQTISSECKPASELDDSWIVGVDDLPECAAGDIRVWLQEFSMVEDVEKFRPHLESDTLCDFGRFGHGKVEVCPVWPAQDVPSRAIAARYDG